MSIVDKLGKTVELEDRVFTTNLSNTSDFKKYGTVVGFSEENTHALVTLDGSPAKSKLLREGQQLMCITQQLKYNREVYPENQL